MCDEKDICYSFRRLCLCDGGHRDQGFAVEVIDFDNIEAGDSYPSGEAHEYCAKHDLYEPPSAAMNLQCRIELGSAYKAGSQIARVVSEDWCRRELYCVACDSNRLVA